MAQIFGLAGSIVLLAMLATAVSHQETGSIISTLVNGFTNSIKAAKA